MRVLVALDPNEDPGPLLTTAIAWGHRMGARLDLKSVSAPQWHGQDLLGHGDFSSFQVVWERHQDDQRRMLTELLDRLPEPQRGTASLLLGDIAGTLIEASSGYDMVMLGTHGRKGLARLFIGSIAEQVVRAAECPALVVRVDGSPIASEGPLRVLIPVDARDPMAPPFDLVHRMLGDDAEVVAMHALRSRTDTDAIALREWAERQVRTALDSAGQANAELQIRTRQGDNAGAEVSAFAEEWGADLVAIATHGRTGWRRVAFGSVAERVVRTAPCAVLVVR